MAPVLEAQGLTVRYGDLVIVDHVDFAVDRGRWLMVVGPNGAGKSTIISAVTGGAPATGRVTLLGRDIRSYRPAALARVLGVLSQQHAVGFAFTVGEVVQMGRYAHTRSLFGATTDEDERAIARALELTGLSALAGQSVLTLSGGELQRTFLAQLFAQDPQVLLLDEPTNHLDLAYQEQVFGLIRDWIAESGRTVLSVVHDLSLARAFGDDVLLLDQGHVVAAGRADVTLTPANLERVYGMDVYAWMRKMLGQWE
ncbi:MAG: ABC transporter ATP-binding protein [Propionibacteriaceae bacterium]|jgi:iron complex transport system ATP-binding protein|nr:ABC transporter ATP-binding protein [Propionibacteriaceae bacterium]